MGAKMRNGSMPRQPSVGAGIPKRSPRIRAQRIARGRAIIPANINHPG